MTFWKVKLKDSVDCPKETFGKNVSFSRDIIAISFLLVKDPTNAGKDWGQEKKGVTEDEMVGWHHRLNGREFEQTLGVGEGQGSLVCCSLSGRKEFNTT